MFTGTCRANCVAVAHYAKNFNNELKRPELSNFCRELWCCHLANTTANSSCVVIYLLDCL